MLVSPTQNSGVGGIAQHQTPMPGILRRSGIIIGLSLNGSVEGESGLE